MEWLGLESTFEISHFQPSCQGQGQFPLGQSLIQPGLVGMQCQKQIQRPRVLGDIVQQLSQFLNCALIFPVYCHN